LINDNDQKVSLKDTISPESGWWPACLIQWHDQYIDFGYPSQAEYYKAIAQCHCVTWAICWYQLFDNSWLFVAWPIYLTSRL
jgi:hypothetical protein